MSQPRRNTKRHVIRTNHKGKKIVRMFWIILLLIVGGFIIYHPIKNLAINKLLKYGTTQWKQLDSIVAYEGVLIRKETVIKSPEQGVFEPLLQEGDKVKAGTIVGYLNTQGSTAQVDSLKIPVEAPQVGLVSFHPDGLEEFLKPDLLPELDLIKVSELIKERSGEKTNFPLGEKGRPICKIVDNLTNPYLYVECADPTIFSLAKGQELMVGFSNDNHRKMVIEDLKLSNNTYLIIAEIFDAPDFGLDNRFVNVNVIAESHEGVSVLKDALVENKGMNGLYVPRKGRCRWVEVEVVGLVGEEAVISGLDIGERYIINPSLVQPGQIIK